VRGGATAVETALVLTPLLMCTLGIFEYGRFLMHLNMLNNAVREGCRYAVVNNTGSSITNNTKTVITNYLGNEARNFSNLTVTLSGTHSGTSTAVNNLAAGDYLTVTATAGYSFMNIIPFVTMRSLTLTRSVTMSCEGAT
jgi:Flp pilus assembly protein TadG